MSALSGHTKVQKPGHAATTYSGTTLPSGRELQAQLIRNPFCAPQFKRLAQKHPRQENPQHTSARVTKLLAHPLELFTVGVRRIDSARRLMFRKGQRELAAQLQGEPEQAVRLGPLRP